MSLREVPKSDADNLKYVPPIDGFIFGTAPAEPEPRFVRAFEIDLEEVMPRYNQLLIFRLFRLLYGEPDVLSGYASISKQVATPIDWGYTFNVGDGVIGELRNRFSSRVNLSFWVRHIPESLEERKKPGSAMAACLKELCDAVDANLHLWEEKVDLSIPDARKMVDNVPAEKYEGGKLLLATAKDLDLPESRRALEWGEHLALRSVGHLYLSAAIFFIIALESYVNVLYRLLLRDEFQEETYRRLTVQSDLDLRMVTMHLFCRGFRSQPVKPGSNLWSDLIRLRGFRNDVVHGNITDEHWTYTLEEAGFLFFYAPATDFRGRVSEKAVVESLPRFQPRIGESNVRAIRKTVDELRNAILDAMTPATRKWADSWLWKPFIPLPDDEAP